MKISKNYFYAMSRYVIYSPRAQPSVNESNVHELSKNSGLIFHMGKVRVLWCKTVVNDWQVFNLSNCMFSNICIGNHMISSAIWNK